MERVEQGIRKRKKNTAKPVVKDDREKTQINGKQNKIKSGSVSSSFVSGDVKEFVRCLWVAVGVAFMVYTGYWFSWYVQTLHENQMWFTNIQEVEREISLRTECGLYYSYYKQLVQSASFKKGFNDLQVDNATEHDRTINILQRFNIYQEVVLAWLYRQLSNMVKLQPILFYVYSIFKLNGFCVSVLFALTWAVCGGSVHWLAGFLTAIFYIVNLPDSTRVFFTINLRESFGFPLFWCQILFVCFYLRRAEKQHYSLAKDSFLSVTILILTYLFALTWQFNQFIMLIQCGSVYVLGLLHLIPEWKTRRLLFLEMAALLLACVSQFGQPMLMGSLLMAFVPGAALSLYLCRDWTISGGIVNGGLKLAIQVCFTLILTFSVHFSLKRYLRIDADDHIFKFLKGKFGFADPRDFDSRLYLCHGAFGFLENDYFYRTSTTLLFPLYMVMLCCSLFTMGKDILSEWCGLVDPKPKLGGSLDPNDITHKIFYFNRRPEVAYLVIQSAISGLLAMMAVRMKFLWTPQMCILAAVLLGDSTFWRIVLSKFKLKSPNLWNFIIPTVLCCGLSAGLIYNYVPTYREQMNELKEFYDPDTVELMYWIGNNTDERASFAGSMQLLAGVKCCTGRHLTNHPHFEDKVLRERTVQVYQIYARRKPDEVYDVLKSFHTDYIILEDSICLAKSDGCRLPDLIDLNNWHVPDNGYNGLYGLRKTTTPRFCDQIRHNTSDYTKYFKLVLQNRTFRVYKLL